MRWTAAVQALGSVSVLGCFAAAEVAARLLSDHPASPAAWFVNLELFGAYERARVASSPIAGLFGPAALWVALGLLAATVAAAAARWRLATALIAHFCFVFTLGLVAASVQARAVVRAASLSPVTLPDRLDGWLVGALVLVSACAAAAGHLSFLAAIRSERGVRTLLDEAAAVAVGPGPVYKPGSQRLPVRGEA